MGAIFAASFQQALEKQNRVTFDQKKALIMKQRQIELSMEFATGKERFLWYQVFFFTTSPLALIGAVRQQNPIILASLIPLSLIYGYQYDLYYGNKLYRIRNEAERLLKEEPQLFHSPHGKELFTEEEYEKVINSQKIVS